MIDTTLIPMDPIKVVRALGSKYTAEILSEAQEPKPVKKIVDEVDVPIATGYRRIQELEELELMVVDGKTISEDGGDIKLYRSRIKEARIEFNESIEIEFVENEKKSDRLVDIWDELK
ncbi:hypothetical protein [Methanonatronarchaeum sp. AMET6-2]|uniref:hypothetical protein n=1 Tax=Methanonatronarchaeum sp. AMET6-2 TaxID=2933293 RepID=UPI001FF4E385|nr:hypothetical protein [Methanonatronarchaeum sp. AMET6-2]UOY10029.1 hypothetical protein MU439_07165 [Methanonatronarchaeum sp. AMET6-2]